MNFGEKLGQAAFETAKKMGNTKSLGKCALAVGDALAAVIGETEAAAYRGHAYQWLSKVQNSKYWKFLKQSTDTRNLPAGSIVIWNRQAAHPYGHVEIANGHGYLCSDFMRSDKLALYKSNPENVVPYIFVPGDKNFSSLPYKVRITATFLNIRTDCRLNASIVGHYKKGDIVDVWGTVHTGRGDKADPTRTWGKNSNGYFDLQYAEKI